MAVWAQLPQIQTLGPATRGPRSLQPQKGQARLVPLATALAESRGQPARPAAGALASLVCATCGDSAPDATVALASLCTTRRLAAGLEHGEKVMAAMMRGAG
jgi:hypothetical protein